MAVLKPLGDAEMDERQRRMMDAMLVRGRDYNVFRTMLHHPAAMEAFWDGDPISCRTRTPSASRFASSRSCARARCAAANTNFCVTR